jgi:glycosyltransferase involved in cell wall biosynthesis
MQENNSIHTPHLAVIMSVYKGDSLPYTQLAIESLQQQTFADYQCFLLFDGPIAQDLVTYLSSLNDKRFVLVKNKENQGLAKSMNQLLNTILPQKNFHYIARMDADDINAKDRFEKQVAFLDSHEEIDCVGLWAIEINAKGEEYYRKQMPVTHQECYEFFSKRDCMIHPTVMFRRSYFEKAGLYPEDTYFGEDTIMWAQGFATGCIFANMPEYLYYFRLNEQFFERRRGLKHAQSILQLRRGVNKMLHYGIKADLFALMYAAAKLMPEKILNLIYKTAR